MGITVKMSFEGKSQQEIGHYGQNIDYSEKENGPRASSAPALGLNTIIFKHVYWYMLQISGERLQDHWSSGYVSPLQGRETYCFSPCVCPSVCPSVRHKPCPLYNLKTVKVFSMKLGTLLNHDKTMCHA